MQRAGIASNRSRVAVVLVIFALLAFTTIRTSPLSTGLEPGSSLSKTTPKQRHLSVQEIVWAIPVLSSVAISTSRLLPHKWSILQSSSDFSYYRAIA